LALLEHIGVQGVAIARSAKRLEIARQALTAEVVRVLAHPVILHLDPLGYATLERLKWREIPTEIRIRVLGAVIRHVGGGVGFQSRAALEDIESGLDQDLFAKTYARTKITATAHHIRFQRESGRPPAAATIDAGQTILWDNRFWVTRFANEQGQRYGPLSVRQLGVAGLKLLREQGLAPKGIRADILHAVPAFWADTALVSVPLLAADGIAAEPVNREGRMWFCSRADLLARVDRNAASE
jgi:hypothetical protein